MSTKFRYSGRQRKCTWSKVLSYTAMGSAIAYIYYRIRCCKTTEHINNENTTPHLERSEHFYEQVKPLETIPEHEFENVLDTNKCLSEVEEMSGSWIVQDDNDSSSESNSDNDNDHEYQSDAD